MSNRGLTLIDPDVLLEVGRDGAKNWEFKPKGEKKPSSADGSAQQVEVRQARIENGSITYRDIGRSAKHTSAWSVSRSPARAASWN
jgi:uncharacterized protein involved in outer membrane biogenesis